MYEVNAMVEQESFQDITKPIKVIPAEDMVYVKTNPEGLTKEGAEFNFKQWKLDSTNKYVIKKYELMLKMCKTFTESGKTEDGKTILARHPDGKIWAQVI